MSFYCPDCHKRIEPAKKNPVAVVCPGCGHRFKVPEEHRPDVLKPGARLGGYEIVRLIGSGGMGKVYEARQLSLNRRVAVKTLSRKSGAADKSMQRFLVEVRATASLQHPHIVTVYEADIQEDLFFLAMAYIDGRSVDKILEAGNQPIPEADALRWVSQVAEAMAYAWRHQKLLHRDIKPANMIIDSQGDVHLCDLGIAKRPTDEFELASAGMAIGTPHYMSPEQGQGLIDIDFRSDIYSLGASLLHMVTATLPYDADDAVNVITKQIMEPLPDPQKRNPKLSDPVCKLLELMMGKLPEQRHSSWDELIHDLERVSEGKYPIFRPHPVGQTTDEAPVPQPETSEHRAVAPRIRPRQHHRLLPVAGMIFVIVLLLSMLVSFLRNPSAPDPYANQTLRPDDGTPPGPLQTETAAPPLDLGTWQDPLASLGDPPAGGELSPDEQAKYLLRDARRQGQSPLSLARQLRTAGRDQEYEAVLWFCIREYHGPDGRWAAEASKELGERMLNLGRETDWLEVQRQRLRFAEIGQPEVTAEAYVTLADYLEREGLLPQAENTLKEGLDRYGRNYVVADQITLRLMTLMDDHNRDNDLRALASAVIATFPENTESHAFAVALARRSKPPADQTPAPEATPEETRLLLANQNAQNLIARLGNAQDDPERIRALFNLADHYRREQCYDQAIDYWQQIVTRYGRRDNGAVGARALQAMAQHYKSIGKIADWQRSLYTLLTNKYYGPGGQLGVRTAKELADYYEQEKNFAMRNRYLRLIIEELPGPLGDSAGEAALRLAKYSEEDKHPFLARTLLQQVVKEFPGRDNRHRLVAEGELKRLNEILPEVPEPPPPEKKLDPGPFKKVITFDARKEQYIEFAQLNRDLSKTEQLTVECWFRQAKKANFVQTLVCRHNDNLRGFHLYIENARITFQFSDGSRDYAVDSPEINIDAWHHVAAVASDQGVSLYLDGKQVANRPGKKLLNEGAGRLRIGRHSKNDLTHFSGGMQNIMIFARAMYAADFKPEPKIHDLKQAEVGVVADDKGIRDLCENQLQLHSN